MTAIVYIAHDIAMVQANTADGCGELCHSLHVAGDSVDFEQLKRCRGEVGSEVGNHHVSCRVNQHVVTAV